MDSYSNDSNTSEFESFIQILVGTVLDIHRDVVENDGGIPGVLHYDLLESAVAAPLQAYGGVFLNSNVFLMAAAYLVGLSKNHAFIDGNKRTAVMLTYMFLEWQGYELVADDFEMQELVLGIIENKITKEEVADYLRTYTRLLDQD